MVPTYAPLEGRCLGDITVNNILIFYQTKQLDSMHVAVGLFNNRSQKRSECSRNISDTLGCINPICDLLLNQQIATWNLFFNFIQFVTPHEHFVVSKKCTFFQNSRIPCCNNYFCSCYDFQVEEVNQCFFFFHLGVDLKKPIQMAYVPGHLYHMLFELLKVCSWHTV